MPNKRTYHVTLAVALTPEELRELRLASTYRNGLRITEAGKVSRFSYDAIFVPPVHIPRSQNAE